VQQQGDDLQSLRRVGGEVGAHGRRSDARDGGGVVGQQKARRARGRAAGEGTGREGGREGKLRGWAGRVRVVVGRCARARSRVTLAAAATEKGHAPSQRSEQPQRRPPCRDAVLERADIGEARHAALAPALPSMPGTRHTRAGPPGAPAASPKPSPASPFAAYVRERAKPRATGAAGSAVLSVRRQRRR
jgi:hypothetical protein